MLLKTTDIYIDKFINFNGFVVIIILKYFLVCKQSIFIFPFFEKVVSINI